jgi:hypothetical protein
MAKFMVQAGLGEAPGQEAGAPRWEPSPEQLATMRASTEMFLGHLLRPTTHYWPDVEALRAAPARIVVAVGAKRRGSSPTAAPWPSRAGSVRPWSSSPATTVDSWPCPSSAAGSWTRCSPR